MKGGGNSTMVVCSGAILAILDLLGVWQQTSILA